CFAQRIGGREQFVGDVGAEKADVLAAVVFAFAEVPAFRRLEPFDVGNIRRGGADVNTRQTGGPVLDLAQRISLRAYFENRAAARAQCLHVIESNVLVAASRSVQ